MLYIYGTPYYLKKNNNHSNSNFKHYSMDVLNDDGTVNYYSVQLQLMPRNQSLLDINLMCVPICDNITRDTEFRVYIVSEKSVNNNFLTMIDESINSNGGFQRIEKHIEYNLIYRYDSLHDALYDNDYNLVVHSSGDQMIPHFACKNMFSKDGTVEYGDSKVSIKNYNSRNKSVFSKHLKYNSSVQKYDMFNMYNFDYENLDKVYMLDDRIMENLKKLNNNVFVFMVNGIWFCLVTFEKIMSMNKFDTVDFCYSKDFMAYIPHRSLYITRFSVKEDFNIIKVVLNVFSMLGFSVRDSVTKVYDNVITCTDNSENSMIFCGHDESMFAEMSLEFKSCFFNIT